MGIYEDHNALVAMNEALEAQLATARREGAIEALEWACGHKGSAPTFSMMGIRIAELKAEKEVTE